MAVATVRFLDLRQPELGDGGPLLEPLGDRKDFSIGVAHDTLLTV
jgi:hypothetical protein